MVGYLHGYGHQNFINSVIPTDKKPGPQSVLTDSYLSKWDACAALQTSDQSYAMHHKIFQFKPFRHNLKTGCLSHPLRHLV